MCHRSPLLFCMQIVGPGSLQLPQTRANHFLVACLQSFSCCHGVEDGGSIFCIWKDFGLLIQDIVHCVRFSEQGVILLYTVVHMFEVCSLVTIRRVLRFVNSHGETRDS